MTKDLCLKRYLSDKRRFADLINGFAGDGYPLVTADDLSGLGSQSESTRTQKYRDRLNKVAFGINFMVIGIEDQLKPCVTLVLYFGDEWAGAKSLHELLDFSDIPRKLREMVNDYRIHILHVQKLTDTSMYRTDVKQVFDAIRFSQDPEKFRELILTDPAYRSLDIEAYDVIVQYTRAKELLPIREKYMKGETVDMCQALTLMLKDERSEGIKEGKLLAGLSAVRNLMSKLDIPLEQTMEMLGMEAELRAACRIELGTKAEKTEK